MPELKPCPFCGSSNVAQGASRDRISVWCFCGARGPEVAFPENCIEPAKPIKECYELWNHRALSTATPADVADIVAEWQKAMEHVTPGPWRVYDGCSWRRIGTAHGRHDDCAVVYPYKAPDGHPDLGASRGNDTQANLEWLARCSPDRINALLATLLSLSARCGEMERALGPFALWIDAIDNNPKIEFPNDAALRIEDGSISVKVTGADFRRAREAWGGEDV